MVPLLFADGMDEFTELPKPTTYTFNWLQRVGRITPFFGAKR
jgi:hypothetical protein